MSSGLERLSRADPPVVPQKRPPWESVPIGQQQVVVYCGGRMCVKVHRKRLSDLRAGSYPQRLFCAGSSFLGSTIPWADDAWAWNVVDAAQDDAPHIRRLISIAGSEQLALERLIGADHARVRKFARDWGFVS